MNGTQKREREGKMGKERKEEKKRERMEREKGSSHQTKCNVSRSDHTRLGEPFTIMASGTRWVSCPGVTIF